jgi:hypothetical protein
MDSQLKAQCKELKARIEKKQQMRPDEDESPLLSSFTLIEGSRALNNPSTTHRQPKDGKKGIIIIIVIVEEDVDRKTSRVIDSKVHEE